MHLKKLNVFAFHISKFLILIEKKKKEKFILKENFNKIMERRQNLKEFNINKMFRIFSIFSSTKKKKSN